MTAMNTDDLALVTGPLKLSFEDLESGIVGLERGEVVRVLEPEYFGDYRVRGLSSGAEQYIDATSLTPLSDIHDDTTIEWGAENEQYVRLSSTHDYVYVEDDE